MKVNYEFLRSLSQPLIIELVNGDRRSFDLNSEGITKYLVKNIRFVESSSGEKYCRDSFLEREVADPKVDEVNHPPHYTKHPSGVECIEISEHFNFNLGNAIKYVWRAGLKSDDAVEDLQKAEWYIKRELLRLNNL